MHINAYNFSITLSHHMHRLALHSIYLVYFRHFHQVDSSCCDDHFAPPAFLKIASLVCQISLTGCDMIRRCPWAEPFQSNQETNFSTTFDTLGLSLCNLILAGSIITLGFMQVSCKHIVEMLQNNSGIQQNFQPQSILDHCHSFRVCSSLCNLWIIQQL